MTTKPTVNPNSCRRTVLTWAMLAAGLVATPARADLAEVKERGTLRVLATVGPRESEFFAVKTGQEPGFEQELLQGFATLQGLRLEVVPAKGRDDLVPALTDAQGDVIAGRFRATDARRKEIAFSVEVFPTRSVVVTRAPKPRIDTLEALRTARVGVVKGSGPVEALQAARVPPEKIDTSIPPDGGLDALEAGRVDAVVLELADAVTAQRKDAQLQLGLFVGAPGIYAFGVRKDDALLRRALDDYLVNLRLTPAWNGLVAKYFGEAAAEILRQARAE